MTEDNQSPALSYPSAILRHGQSDPAAQPTPTSARVISIDEVSTSGPKPGAARHVPTVDYTSPEPYKIGYKKPPRSGCFKKGQRENPNGRPKGAKNALEILLEEADMKISVREGSRTRKMSKFRVGVRKAMNSFAEKGDLKNMLPLLKFVVSVSGGRTNDQRPSQPEAEALTAHESMMLELWDMFQDDLASVPDMGRLN